MQKLIKLLLSLALGLSLAACSSSKDATSAMIADNVELSMVDVLEVDNKPANTVFFYFLAGVENKSDAVYHMSNLNYSLRAKTKDGYRQINPIDQYKTIISNDVQPGMSTYIYGYIGVPKTSDKSIGLYVEGKDAYIPFSSTKIRKIDESKITNSTDAAFTIYDDEYYEFDVDATQLAYHYADGKSTIDGLKINYKNKTDSRLVIPYLTPICTIDGFNLDSFSNSDELKKMSQEEISKYDFTSKGLPAKTESIRAEAYGYELFYLGPNQEVSANVIFEADNAIPDFSAKMKNGITININSPSLGYRQIMKVNY